ncbi:hypothetical protein [Thiothrix nivea]|uniref:Pectate lyase n=1 Tax=Thiothrix nivea (strain ATCC 35100 / DSM 5205 / JP2) TaxID=870187 RepID=A0A656HJZ1_THINJ|nr:hypothetical protein [Thiothrix nivea]EIJ36613.1 pectate lyase [Thiothrix nivea DSM 5205]
MLRILLLYFVCTSCAQALPVFPGAEGFGTRTSGGRGGIVCKVTNLDDDGSGSLRDCVEKTQPRIVVFTTGGTIHLESNLTISNPYISIFGQTAPGDGIMITGAPTIRREPFTIATHDVLIQHVRFRAGAADEANCCRDALSILGAEGKTDGRQTYNVVLDHCSFSWGTDEIISTWYDAHDLTISNSIIGPSLYNGSNDEGPGSRGVLLGSEGSHSISLHHNLIVHSQERNPGIKTGTGVVDVVNNLVYNWGHNGAEIMGELGNIQANLVHNLYVMGPDSNREMPEIVARNSGEGYQLFLEENLSIREHDQPEPLPVDFGLKGWPTTDWESSIRFPAPPITTFKAQTLLEKLLPIVGATLPKRDPVDTQAIHDTKTSQGEIPQCVSSTDQGWTHGCKRNAGGWPPYTEGKPYPDQDGDGIPDAWETANNLNPEQADATDDRNVNGYSNIEEWVFSLTPSAEP